MKNVLLEKKIMKYMTCVKNTTQIMQHVYKMRYISLLLKDIQ